MDQTVWTMRLVGVLAGHTRTRVSDFFMGPIYIDIIDLLPVTAVEVYFIRKSVTKALVKEYVLKMLHSYMGHDRKNLFWGSSAIVDTHQSMCLFSKKLSHYIHLAM